MNEAVGGSQSTCVSDSMGPQPSSTTDLSGRNINTVPISIKAVESASEVTGLVPITSPRSLRNDSIT